MKDTDMLIRIVITNFRSYRQETEFNMLPSSNVRRKDGHVHSRDRGANVLRTAVVYGANGAGKSCLIKALGRLQAMVAAGSLLPTAFRDANKYNDSDMPVTIEVEFGTESDQYSYGVSYCGEEQSDDRCFPVAYCQVARHFSRNSFDLHFRQQVFGRDV